MRIRRLFSVVLTLIFPVLIALTGCMMQMVAPDFDNDGTPDADDVFPADPREHEDSDTDGIGDNSDAFPLDEAEQLDTDGDGQGNNADDDDDDDDQIADADDVNPLVPQDEGDDGEESSAQIGFTNEQTGAYTAIDDGYQMPIFTFGQGGSHMFVTIRFPADSLPDATTFDVTYIVFRQSDGRAIAGFEEPTEFTMVENDILEASRRVVFLSEFPDLLDGATADMTVVVRLPSDSTQAVTIEKTLVLDFNE